MERSDEHLPISIRPQNPEKRIFGKRNAEKRISEKRISRRPQKLEKRVTRRSRAPKNRRHRKRRRRRRVAKSIWDLGFSDSDESLDLLTLMGKARRKRVHTPKAPSNFPYSSNANDVGNNYGMSGTFHIPTHSDTRSAPFLSSPTSQDAQAIREPEEVEISEGLLSRRRVLRNANIPSKLFMHPDGRFAIPEYVPKTTPSKPAEVVPHGILKTQGSRGSGRKVSWENDTTEPLKTSTTLPDTVPDVGPPHPDSATHLRSSTVMDPLKAMRSPTHQEALPTVEAPPKPRRSPAHQEALPTVEAPLKPSRSPAHQEALPTVEAPLKPMRSPAHQGALPLVEAPPTPMRSPAHQEALPTAEASPIPRRSPAHQEAIPTAEAPSIPMRRPSPTYQEAAMFQNRLVCLMTARYGDESSESFGIHQSSV
ncbi:MAG: uncharacterized protein KVP18_000064 [Porospora cf. gigantea A]|nr:MAG: hypothetical protein KVP18_000064 [Porospora cf. gigantea A]